MPKTISRTLNITRVSFCTVKVEDGAPQFVPHPDAIFPGQLEKDKVKKLLQGRYGKDAILVITNIDAGQHRYSMGLEDFVLHATITDGAIDDEEEDCELPDSPEDDNTEGSPAPAPEAMPNTGAAPVPPGPGGEEAGAHDWALYDGELPDEPVGW